ncbi:MAG: FtsX-like permease family protein [Rhodothermales bacterium]|nr:FtsX-like permease family protein [Rhodothermales bacterium]
MIRHYLRTTFRVLLRQASFSAINLVGLSVGIAAALLLLLFVRNEITFDSAHEKSDRIYRAWVKEDYGPNQVHFNTSTPYRTGPDLEAGIPEVEAITRFDRFSDTVRRGVIGHTETINVVETNFLDVFDFEVLAGDRATMLGSQESIVLTQSAVNRYFGTETPLGEVLSIDFGDEPRQFQVTGVLADPPENSSLQFEVLLSFAIEEWYYSDRFKEAFFNVSPETYVLLAEGADISAVEAKIPGVITSVIGDRVEEGQYQVGLQPLTDIHMNPDFPEGFSTVINPMYVRILMALALLILAVACINFVTLSVSRSLTRAKEIGVRKVIGADRSQLMAQYWGEALMLTGLSLVAGFALARAFLPGFNALAQRNLSLQLDPATLLLLAGIFVLVGLLAGLYPALVLSRFSPIDAFRGSVSSRRDRGRVRRGLVVGQFALSILLISSTLLIGRQLDYLENKDLGFSEDSVVSIATVANISDGQALADRLRFRLAGDPAIKSLTSAAMLFDQNGWARIGYQATDGTYKRHFVNVVDHDFIETLELRLRTGRNFDRNQPGDADRAVIVNEAFVRTHGWTDPLTGQIPGPNFDEHEIIGVVEDFHFASLHTEIRPALFVLSPNVAFSGAMDADYGGSFAPEIAIRVDTDNLPTTLARIEQAWTEVAPEMPFSYSFVDDNIAQQYRQEARLSQIVRLGALLSILIAGLGLFGLASLSVNRRSKEIGLRKVLGSSVAGIVGLFTREFSILVGIAFVVAVPVAWYAMSVWVSGFAYRAPIGVVPFVLAGIAALLVMLVAVSYQAIRASMANPVDALRDE